MRLALDLAARWSGDTETDDVSALYVLGIDAHKVLSDQKRDLAVIVFQPYWVQLRNVASPGPIFDDGDDGALQWRIANINYLGLSNGGVNIRFGHFEIPFGLEYELDTNGTLRQFSFSERGIKADWGMSINGQLPNLNYEMALTRGSGNSWEQRDDPYILSGRLGTPSQQNIVLGLSYFYGDVLLKEGVERRKRVGLDASYYYRHWQFSAEASMGRNENLETASALLEYGWRNRSESVFIYNQWQWRYQEVLQDKRAARDNTHYELALGVHWSVARDFSMSAQLKYLDGFSQMIDDHNIASVQLRLRY